MIGFPNGNRVTKEIPCSSQFLAIVEYVKSEGFDLDKHKIVTNFPRKILTDLDTKQTLKEMGLFLLGNDHCSEKMINDFKKNISGPITYLDTGLSATLVIIKLQTKAF